MIEKRDFSRKLGSTISKSEYERTIRNLQSQKMVEQDFSKKYKLTKKIKYLKELEKKE
jgi:DNA-binding IclR family transcriptional regulator